MLGKCGAPMPPNTTAGVRCGGVLRVMTTDRLIARTPWAELQEIAAAIKNGDNLPNTAASLNDKVKRRALLVVSQYEADGRNTNGQSLFMPTTPRDVLRVYRMLLTRGYEAQNIRILAEGILRDRLTHAARQNIIDSFEWLSHGAEPGDHRYVHFSGHTYAYELEEIGGKAARASHMPSAVEEHKLSTSSTWDEQPSQPPSEEVKFYREALLAQWRDLTVQDLPDNENDWIGFAAYNRVDDEEVNAMISKLPKGCILTMTLDCFHGANMDNVEQESPRNKCRGGPGWPIVEPEGSQSSTNLFDTYPNTSPRNLFVPPLFRLYSDFTFDPKVTMERVRGPDPLNDVKATVFVWSAFNTAFPPKTGVFTSAFTSVVQEIEGDISYCALFQKISQRVGEATESKRGHPLVQLCTSLNDEDEVLMNQPFVL